MINLIIYDIHPFASPHFSQYYPQPRGKLNRELAKHHFRCSVHEQFATDTGPPEPGISLFTYQQHEIEDSKDEMKW